MFAFSCCKKLTIFDHWLSARFVGYVYMILWINWLNFTKIYSFEYRPLIIICPNRKISQLLNNLYTLVRTCFISFMFVKCLEVINKTFRKQNLYTKNCLHLWKCPVLKKRIIRIDNYVGGSSLGNVTIVRGARKYTNLKQ